ncbi:MAG: CAP domain-containing protein [Candidatus Aminicenantes bacterium]|nr:CAP domain-containing protein [Candidatus Aminicenantes bacterium]
MNQRKLAAALFSLFVALSAQTMEELGLSPEQLEEKLFLLVNRERSSHGLSELRLNPLLRSLAREHSKKMARERQLAHDFPGYGRLAVRARNAGLRFLSIGENLAVGDIFIMRFFHERMMESPGHRENILFADFTDLGVGIELSGNRYYVTQEFAGLDEP